MSEEINQKLANFPNLQKGKPFEKGKSGNPKGKPRGLPELNKILVKVLKEKNGDGITAAEGMIRAMVKEAIKKGNTKACEILLNRAYGIQKRDVDFNGEINLNSIQVPVINILPPTDSEINEG